MGNDVSLLDRSEPRHTLPVSCSAVPACRWYKTDTNHVPPQSILQPIDSVLPNFLNKKEPTLQAQDAAAWWAVQARIQVRPSRVMSLH
jgi:hypothetical protein